MRYRATLLVVTVLGLLAPFCGMASAAAATPRPSPADGVSVDLSHGWGDYRACMVIEPGRATCFTTKAAMDAGGGGAKISSASAGSCPVSLFNWFNYSGRSLAIYVRGYWLNLSDYGFDKATVSFVGNGCGFHLAEGYWGGGYWYPGYTGPWAYASNMGPYWNNRVSSIYIP